ncbi:SpoIIE family protein phosphatase [Streptomyces gamaensis]|uniref:SpoIIE family protein phosphatase n=1 Tax=Streptomyces gamaensis TaxID=1763542 RepID=A0ABW0YWQ1_9ACTN
MTTPHLPKVAGIDPPVPPGSQTSAPEPPASAAAPSGPAGAPPSPAASPTASAAAPPLPAAGALVQDRLASWIFDLTTLQELTERLARTTALDAALHEVLRAGAQLVGARRGLATLRPSAGGGRATTAALGLARADLGIMETVPYGPGQDPGRERLFGLLPPAGSRAGRAHPDLAADEALGPRHREAAARLGCGAGYVLPLETAAAGRLGAVVWFYDEPAAPTERQRHLVGLYRDFATEHLARHLELAAAREGLAALRTELLPGRLPSVPGVRLAVRHRPAPSGGAGWYDALPLPEGALGLAVGGAGGSGPAALAAAVRLRACLRAYAVMEGEDPVAVLSDLELLLRLTDPGRAATALFAYCEPAGVPQVTGGRRQSAKVVLAGAGHCPPLIVGERRTEYVETSLSAPLGMLSCWEAPSVEIEPAAGETLLLYGDGLLRATGEPMDRAFALLHAAALGVPSAARGDPRAVAEHVLRTVVPEDGADGEDLVLLAARFE